MYPSIATKMKKKLIQQLMSYNPKSDINATLKWIIRNHSLIDFLEGVLYGCNDAGSIPDALASGYAIIAVVDIEEAYKYANVPNLAIMSNLLPPPEAVTAYIDGEAAIGHQIYYEYLSNREHWSNSSNCTTSFIWS